VNLANQVAVAQFSPTVTALDALVQLQMACIVVICGDNAHIAAHLPRPIANSMDRLHSDRAGALVGQVFDIVLLANFGRTFVAT
jgi:hypothetical protein